MENQSLLIIEKKISKNDKIIRFYHPNQDLTKVSTLIDIFYDGEYQDNKIFFLEKQKIRNNIFDLPILQNKQSIRIVITKSNPVFNLSDLIVEIH